MSSSQFSPVFIVGCQRSGTTMLGAMLGSHHQVLTTPESQFVVDCMPDFVDEELDTNYLLNKITSHPRFKIWNFELQKSPSKTSMLYVDFIRWLIDCYRLQQGKKIRYWVEHQPGNVKSISKLKTIFPDLKVIHIIRDGRAVANSIMPLDWGPNTISRAAYFWQQRVGLGLSVKEFLPTGSYLQLRYEDVLDDVDSELLRICEFLDLDYEPDMVEGKGLILPDFTKNQHQLVGHPPVEKRKLEWRKKLSKREIEIFEYITGDMLVYLGYERIYNILFKKPSEFELFYHDFNHVSKSIYNKFIFNRRLSTHAKL